MKQKKKTKSIGLGRGLSGLLGKEVEKKSENFKMIPVELIKPGPWQPRKTFNKDELISLSNSIDFRNKSLDFFNKVHRFPFAINRFPYSIQSISF